MTKRRVLRLEETLRIDRLCIPLRKCVCVSPGPVSGEIVKTLKSNRYSQAPVYDPESGIYRGLVSTAYLESLLSNQQDLSVDDQKIEREEAEFFVGSMVSIYSVFERMETNQAVMVTTGGDCEEYGYQEFIHGLFTIADLNRHEVRGILHVLFSQVEAGLARLIERTISDPWEWIRLLNEDGQVRVVGSWELSKRKGVDTSPISATTLTQLIAVGRSSEALRNALGFPSSTSFSKATSGIINLRNRVMHPVRPLVFDIDEVRRVNRALGRLEAIRNRLEKVELENK